MKKIIITTWMCLSVLVMAVGGTMAAYRDTSELTGITAKQYLGGEAIAGATLQILDEEGNLVKEWISEKKEFVIEAELLAGATYTLHEAKAPDGYLPAEDITFTVSEDGEWTSVEMQDAPTEIHIAKKDKATEYALAGATLQVLDPKGKVIDEWVTDEKPHEIVGLLKAGITYRIHEAEAPFGYEKSADMEFIVPEHEGPAEYVFYNVKGKDPEVPQTGDKISIILLGVGACMALGGAMVVVMLKKKSE